jgi:hypothetical protein
MALLGRLSLQAFWEHIRTWWAARDQWLGVDDPLKILFGVEPHLSRHQPQQ